MYALIRSTPLRSLLTAELPALVLSLLVAEAFYKFGSFTQECLAFLVTWLVADAVLQAGARLIARAVGGRRSAAGA